MKNKNKIFIVIIISIIIVIYGLIVIVFSNSLNNNGSGNTQKPNGNESGNNEIKENFELLLLNNISIWKYQNYKWTSLEEFEIVDDKFQIYINNNYYGSYYVKYGNKINLLDDNTKFISYTGDILAATNSLVTPQYFNMININNSDLLEIQNIIGNIPNLELSLEEKVEIDLDKNGIIDKIINVSNIDSKNQEKYFNLCYILLNGNKIELVNEKIEKEDLLIVPIYNIKYILNTNYSNYKNIVLQKGYFSNSGKTANEMYQYNGKKYLKVVDDE